MTTIPDVLRRLIGIATDRAGLGLTDAQLAHDIAADSWYTILAREAYTLGADAERHRLIGVPDDDFDGDEAGYGLLDRITVGVSPANDTGHRVVYTRCHGGCGDQGGGTVMIVARDMEGSQAALTLAELAHRALIHIGEEHDGRADWPVLTISDDGRPVETLHAPALAAEPTRLRWELQIAGHFGSWLLRKGGVRSATDADALASLAADEHLEDRPTELRDKAWRVLVGPAATAILTPATATAIRTGCPCTPETSCSAHLLLAAGA